MNQPQSPEPAEPTKINGGPQQLEENDVDVKITKDVGSSLEEEILRTVVASPAVFKSQQKGDPELSADEKLKIACELLHRSHHQFLSRFGKFLNSHLLDYFLDSEDYEVTYHVNRLRRHFDNKSRRIDMKNRRYEALKELIERGEYFSETEMMKRNPLLYENLVGKYLTEEQRKARDSLDKDITFVNLLMEGIERDGMKTLKRSQEDAEDEVLEENDSDEESEHEEVEKCPLRSGKGNWGEMEEVEDRRRVEAKDSRTNFSEINYKEQQMLRQEFVTHMYQSFLDGRDTDFDYSTVDDNEVYDNVELREQDEEEKYFDSESPEAAAETQHTIDDESEDELDKYMKTLKEGDVEDDVKSTDVDV